MEREQKRLDMSMKQKMVKLQLEEEYIKKGFQLVAKKEKTFQKLDEAVSKKQKEIELRNRKRYNKELEEREDKERLDKLRKNGAYFRFSKEIQKYHKENEETM